MKHKKRFFKALLCMFLIASMAFPMTVCAWSESDYYDAPPQSSGWVSPDLEEGWYIFQTLDKKKTSSTYYRTLGFTISRCVLGEQLRHPLGQYVTVVLSEYDPNSAAYEGITLLLY